MMLFLPKMPMGWLSPGASIMMHQGIAISLLLLQPLKGFGTLALTLTSETGRVLERCFWFWPLRLCGLFTQIYSHSGHSPRHCAIKLRKALCYWAKDSSFLWRSELGVETGVSRPLRAKAFHHCHHLPPQLNLVLRAKAFQHGDHHLLPSSTCWVYLLWKCSS